MTDLASTELLDVIRAQAAEADQTRSVANDVLQAIRASELMRLSASANIGGSAASIVRIGDELRQVAAACTSTAWCLWNHLCTFHLFCGLLGPANQAFLRGVVERAEWVCFPAGASTAVQGEVLSNTQSPQLALTGKAAFGSGARYADWAGVSFVLADAEGPQFSMIDLHQDGVQIDADWFAMSLRASATDTVCYDGGSVPSERVVPFPFRYREVFRDAQRAMIDHRYREDWVALSDLWLGWMAAGLAQQALDEVCTGIKDRIAIMGVKVAQRPTVHVNLGAAQAAISAAQDTVRVACEETDARISAQILPTEDDYLRQLAASMQALALCDEAFRLLLRVMGGNGLREGGDFERRYRDFQAMPLHINAHRDRVTEQYGRQLLGLPTENPF